MGGNLKKIKNFQLTPEIFPFTFKNNTAEYVHVITFSADADIYMYVQRIQLKISNILFK